MRAHIIENDAALANFLTHALSAEHYEVKVSERVEQLSPRDADLVLLDFNLSVGEAIRATRALRGRAPTVLVIGLGAQLGSKEVVAFLDAGADDYMAKPFSFAELAARIRALRRRNHASADALLKIADLSMDRVQRQVVRAGRLIELTTKEFALLEFLMLNSGRRVSRAEILEHVWKALPCPGSTNLVDVYIAYVRKKIDGDSPEKLIHTTRGIGYEISAPQQSDACGDCTMPRRRRRELRGC